MPELQKAADDQLAQAQAALSAVKGDWCVFNPHAVPAVQRVRHPETKRDLIVSLPPLSGTPLHGAAVSADPVCVTKQKVSNGLVEFEVGRDGWINSVTMEGKPIPLREPLGQLALYPDYPANFEAWDIDRQALSLGEIIRNRAAIKPWQDGDLARGIEVDRKVGLKSRARARFYLEGGSPLLHIAVELDWNEPQHLLKLHFPTAFAATNARFGAPFGSVLRPQLSTDLASEAKWEVPFSRYLAVFDEGEVDGLYLVTESNYGATVRDGDIGLSLVRSPRVTGIEAHATAWPGRLSRLKIPSTHSDIGHHEFRLALGAYSIGLPRHRQPASVAETLFTPPVSYQGRPFEPVLQALEGDSTLIPTWVKPLEDGAWLLRLHEVAGRRGTIRLQRSPDWKIKAADLQGGAMNRSIQEISFSPYQIVTLRVQAEHA